MCDFDFAAEMKSGNFKTSELSYRLSHGVNDGLGRLRKRVDYTLVSDPGGTGPSGLGPLSVGAWLWQWASETHYIYDGRRVIQERDTNNVPTVAYTRGNDER